MWTDRAGASIKVLTLQSITTKFMIDEARGFAHYWHDAINQKRKYTGEPYWVHTDEVAKTVASVTSDRNLIVAAHLHDIFEDVAPSHPEVVKRVERNFGEDIYWLVHDLTDKFTRENFPTYKRDKRKALEAERIGSIRVGAKTVKLADLLSNTSSIVQHDPKFAKVYVQEKIALLPYLQDGDATLWARANEQVEKAKELLKL
jgi:(p)ppGpp synthase/HD superfamily hydrolase